MGGEKKSSWFSTPIKFAIQSIAYRIIYIDFCLLEMKIDSATTFVVVDAPTRTIVPRADKSRKIFVVNFKG